MSLRGKISRVTPLKFTPNGLPLLELVVAVSQDFMGERSVGYFDVVFSNDEALNQSGELKVGRFVEVDGSLWSRKYKDRAGNWIIERKVIAKKITEEMHE